MNNNANNNNNNTWLFRREALENYQSRKEIVEYSEITIPRRIYLFWASALLIVFFIGLIFFIKIPTYKKAVVRFDKTASDQTSIWLFISKKDFQGLQAGQEVFFQNDKSVVRMKINSIDSNNFNLSESSDQLPKVKELLRIKENPDLQTVRINLEPEIADIPANDGELKEVFIENGKRSLLSLAIPNTNEASL